MNQPNKITNIILNIILVFLLLIGLLVGFSLLPIKNNYKLYTVNSGSMGNSIPVGSLVVVKPQEAYQVGDVITYQPAKRKSNETVTHRIIEVKTENNRTIYIAKGDANKDPDQETIIKDKIIGKSIYHIGLLGYLIGFVKTPVGLILVIVVPATVIIYEEIKKIKEEYKHIKSKKEHK